MALDIADVRRRAQAVGTNYSRSQKVTMFGAFVAVMVLVYAFARMSSGAEMAPLYTELATGDAAAVTERLTEEGIPYELAAGGSTVMVPKDVVYDTRLALADIELAGDGTVGYGILDDQGLTTSEFGQRVGFQRAMEGELARTIEAIDSVETAIVHLAIPEDQVFALDDAHASASVMVKTRPGQQLDAGQVQAVINLVASSIEGMNPESVTVADSTGMVLAAPGETNAAGNDMNQRQAQSYEDSVSAAITEMITAVAGAGHSRVTVSADLNFDERTTTQETFEQPVTPIAGEQLATAESTETETYTGAAAEAAGVLGTETLPGDAVAGAGATSYERNRTEVNNALNRVVAETREAPGDVERLSIAVLVDQEVVNAEQAEQLRQAVGVAAGIDAELGEVVVTRMPFDTSTADTMVEELEAAEAEAQAAESQKLMQTLMVVGVVALVLAIAYLSFRRAARRRREAMEVRELSAGSAGSLSSGTTIDLAELAAAAGLGNAIEVASKAPAIADMTSEDRQRLDRQAAVADLIDNQPEEVAQLLRGWLGDRRTVRR